LGIRPSLAKCRVSKEPVADGCKFVLAHRRWAVFFDVGREEPITVHKYKIEFKAYIPNTLGFRVAGSPVLNVHWDLVPGPRNFLRGGGRYAFATDNRTLPNSPGTSRLSLSMTFDAHAAGHLKGQLSSPNTDLSHEIIVRDSTPKALRPRWTHVSGSAKGQRSNIVHGADKIYNQFSSTGRQSIVDAHVAAGYPFAFSFAIDLDLHVVIDTDSQGRRGTIEITARCNSFPAYELLVNGFLEDWRRPADSGPGLNLAGAGSQVLRGRRYFDD
jgi:hypothetical protein